MYKERELPIPRSGRHLVLEYISGILKVVGFGSVLITILAILIHENHTLWTGGIILFYFLNQCFASFSNKALYSKIAFPSENDISSNDISDMGVGNVGIVMVGYREKPEYFQKCMNSLRLFSSEFVNVVVLVVDGDEVDDKYMIDMAEQEWSKTDFQKVPTPVTPLFPPSSSLPSDEEEAKIMERSKPILVTFARPHQGKRATMAYGIDFLRTEYPNNREIIVMDSDTFLRKESIPNLVRGFRQDEKNGCMTGSIEIFNRNYFLPRIVHARYGYAFSLERGAMSWYGCMNCCSGPFSIYRQDILDDELMVEFNSQKCCGELVGPGDDRHLTNLVMMKGFRSRQNPYAVAWTETPKFLFRYLQQQLRWSRSFYREQVFQIYATTHQNFFLTCVTIWEIVFPFFIIMGFFPYFNSSVITYIHRIGIAVIVALLRTLILIMFYEGDISYSYNMCIVVMYFGLLLPVKLYALSTCFLQQWITSSRKSLTTIISPDIMGMVFAILLWYTLFASSLYLQWPHYQEEYLSNDISWKNIFSISI